MSRKKVPLSEIDTSKIGGRIAFIRISNDQNQEEFSKITGISKGNLSGLENNKYDPSYQAIVKILEFYSIRADWLLFGNGTPFKEYNEKDSTAIQIVESENGFVDTGYAAELTSYLRDIEAINPNTFRETGAYIKGVANTLKSMVKSQQSLDRRRGERRKRNEQPLVEQRSGIDRRKASGL